METCSVSLKEFVHRAWSAYEESLQQIKRQHDEQRLKCEEIRRSVSVLASQIDETERVQALAAKSGLDTSPLEPELQRLRNEHAQRVQHLRYCEPESEPVVPLEPFNRSTMSRIVEHLERHNAGTARSLASLAAAIELVTIEPDHHRLNDQHRYESDEEGRIHRVLIRFDGAEIGVASVSESPALFLSDFTPEGWDFVTELETSKESVHSSAVQFRHDPSRLPRIHVLENSGQLLVATPYQRTGLVSVASTSQRPQMVSGEWEYCQSAEIEINGSVSPFVVMADVLAESLRETDGCLVPNHPYRHAFAHHLQKLLLTSSRPLPRWKRQDKHHSSQTVLELIRGELQTIVHAPWGPDLVRNAAKLKYTLEGNERPRLWYGPFEHTYGLRVRTRDHTWLVANIFIDPRASEAHDDGPILVRGHAGHMLRRGRVYVHVAEVDD